ncbi:MAG: hypothetical protein OEQ47_01205 [Acidimicrobiia bacterium]|nr:hypothetical protein [Acidimicrobiia bacterium]
MGSLDGPSKAKRVIGLATVAGVLAAVVAVGFIFDLFPNDSGEAAANLPANAGTAGERENPLGSTAPPPSSDDATPNTGTPTPSSPSSEATTDDSTGGDDPIPEGDEVSLEPQEMVLVSASAEVTGFGSSVFFKAGPGALNAPTDFLDPEGGPYPGTDSAVVEVVDANCLFTTKIVLVQGGPDESPHFKFAPQGFGAGFRANQFNHVSIGVSDGIVAGGFSFGGEGRGNSQQWPIEGGGFNVEAVDFPAHPVEGQYVLAVRVTWSGTSIENYTGEESAGNVVITCVWAEKEARSRP